MFLSTYHLDSIFNSAPDKHDLLELLVDTEHLWYNIGEALRVPYPKLMSLQHSSLPDLNKLSSVLQCWIDKCTTEVTWSSIITAMKSKIVEQAKVGEEIRRHVLSNSQQYNSSHLAKNAENRVSIERPANSSTKRTAHQTSDNLLSSERLFTEQCIDEQRKQSK